MRGLLKRCIFLSLGFFAIHARPKVTNDVPTLYEGDMALTDEQVQALGKNSTHTAGNFWDQEAHTRGAIRNPAQLWPDGIIPFVIRGDIDAEGKQLIRNSMKDWEKHVCVKFKERGDEKGYLQFIYDKGCWSYVGYTGDRQEVSIGRFTRDPPCEQGALTHEIGHALGFYHEQNRPDRDNYVRIIWSNLRYGTQRNFKKETESVINSRGVKYDFGSLMHYSKFQGNNRPGVETIKPKDPSVDIGQRKGPSKLDIEQARLMYKCDEAAVANKPKPPAPAGVTTPSPVSRPPPAPPSRPSRPSFPRPPGGSNSGADCKIIKTIRINARMHKVIAICRRRRPKYRRKNKGSDDVKTSFKAMDAERVKSSL